MKSLFRNKIYKAGSGGLYISRGQEIYDYQNITYKINKNKIEFYGNIYNEYITLPTTFICSFDIDNFKDALYLSKKDELRIYKIKEIVIHYSLFIRNLDKDFYNLFIWSKLPDSVKLLAESRYQRDQKTKTKTLRYKTNYLNIDTLRHIKDFL